MSEEYHLSELKIARNPSDPRRILPLVPQSCHRVLDLGCGAGQSLVAMDLGKAVAVGVDVDLDALHLGRQITENITFLQAKGEALPFKDGTFDFAFSRVALPYMDIPKGLREVARVLQSRGQVWFTLHPFSSLSCKKSFTHPKRALFEIYRLANTGALHWLNYQFSFPLKRSRVESYQTMRGMRIALERAGFEHIRFTRGAHFLVTASKK